MLLFLLLKIADFDVLFKILFKINQGAPKERLQTKVQTLHLANFIMTVSKKRATDLCAKK